MAMDPDLARHIFEYCPRKTIAENRAHWHLTATIKATGRSDVQAQAKARNHHIYSRDTSSDPEVLDLARDGYQAFVQRTAERMFREHRAEIWLNCCPRCKGVARTPAAQQCRYCLHRWVFNLRTSAMKVDPEAHPPKLPKDKHL